MTYEITYRYESPKYGNGIDGLFVNTRAKTEKGIARAAKKAMEEQVKRYGMTKVEVIDFCKWDGRL